MSKTISIGQPGRSDLQFPLFTAGQLLYDHDLAVMAEYTREITRLMLRSLFGCGVVCGLCVTVDVDCGKLVVRVSPGVAIDCEGDLVHVTKAITIKIDPACGREPFPDRLWVLLRGFEKCCAPRVTECSSDEDDVTSACTREQYWHEVQLRAELPECVCGCAEREDADKSVEADSPAAQRLRDELCACADPERPCYADHYAGKCACGCAGCDACSCEWILLARLDRNEMKNEDEGDEERDDDEKPWSVEHGVRRFIRPVLMRDPRCLEKALHSDRHPQHEPAPPKPEPTPPRQPERPPKPPARKKTSATSQEPSEQPPG